MGRPGFLSPKEREYIQKLEGLTRSRSHAFRPSPGYERVLRYRIRRKADFAIGELTRIVLAAPDLAPELTYDDAVLFSVLFRQEAQKEVVREWIADESRGGLAKLRRAWRRESPEAKGLRGREAENHYRLWLRDRVLRHMKEEDERRSSPRKRTLPAPGRSLK